MDQRVLLEYVESVELGDAEGQVNKYAFANTVADMQREASAKVFEDLGFNDIAQKIRTT